MSTTTSPYGDPATRARILDATWELVIEQGAAFKLSDVAARAAVSRQAVYLHFGDRSGLLVGLVQHMDDSLDLGDSLAAVHAAPDGEALLAAAMRLNTTFWRLVLPVAQVLEASQHVDEALGAAWRDRMRFRQATFRSMVETLAGWGELDEAWTVSDAAEMLYGIAHFDTWRELVVELGWTDDHYVESMTRLLGRALLGTSGGRAS
ncbi:MAG: TetR/AcrR family transcriptional regulator [Acidimicrobiales bacterium]|nr:TetR/AcrR family transcriptional regulator [Acidimicrobiales bacterium]